MRNTDAMASMSVTHQGNNSRERKIPAFAHSRFIPFFIILSVCFLAKTPLRKQPEARKAHRHSRVLEREHTEKDRSALSGLRRPSLPHAFLHQEIEQHLPRQQVYLSEDV